MKSKIICISKEVKTNMYVEVNELDTMLLVTNLILDNLASTVVLGSLPLQPEENHDED